MFHIFTVHDPRCLSLAFHFSFCSSPCVCACIICGMGALVGLGLLTLPTPSNNNVAEAHKCSSFRLVLLFCSARFFSFSFLFCSRHIIFMLIKCFCFLSLSHSLFCLVGYFPLSPFHQTCNLP